MRLQNTREAIDIDEKDDEYCNKSLLLTAELLCAQI